MFTFWEWSQNEEYQSHTEAKVGGELKKEKLKIGLN